MINERDELISKLLFKQITNTISEEETRLLTEWRKENIKNEELYIRMLDIKMLEQTYRQRKAVNVERPDRKSVV